ncbi:uncharacterized protein LAESUDRAFT_726121 [Laetiporus sulphureus 93-53]|uniref:Myb-like transcription factor n=1 Tax=Laetiporus sulphureus 93-53 TaxID=1314785 RepID=A0A165E5W7_9APHY|nr:uncharacterized protein LAESUDRAFT_726121 [Laetiporus sulphureus 93-53]KZT06298.1 hypothetical protein LAESUDRAFT_726121 [Laetiporus sulphureus 93-53]
MQERGVGKPWTKEEDNLLIQAVAVHGENDNWKIVALSVPGRTNKACRKRWLHSLSPNVKKSAWTPEEDQLLLSLYAIHSTKWAVIARHISGRTDDACSKRYREALDPSLKRDEWTSDEDARLLEAYNRLGGRWGQIGQELQRSGLACRNRWRMLERKKKAAATRDAGPSNAASTATSQQPVEPLQPQWDIPPEVAPQGYWNPPAEHAAPSSVPFASVPSETLVSGSPYYSEMPETYAYAPDRAIAQSTLHSGPQQFDYPQYQFDQSYQPFQDYDGYYTQPPQAAQDVHPPQTLPFNPEDNNHGYVPGAPPDVVNGAPVIDRGTTPFRSEEVSSQPYSACPGTSASSNATPPDSSDINHPTAGVPEEAADRPSVVLASQLFVYENGDATVEATGSRNYYRDPKQKAKDWVQQRRATRRGPSPRLSSSLPATSDTSVLAYACGHLTCWPTDVSESKSRFATSKELSDHSKAEHTEDFGGSTPFRCGLAGCKKSWKSINGLQYHLQISKTHFQQALSTLPAAAAEDNAAADPSTTARDVPDNREPENGREAEAGTAKATPAVTKPRKTYPCPHRHCPNRYKQLSGLRYHLAHGHPNELPAQLDAVPPALVRKMAEKTQAKASAVRAE